MNCIIQIHGCLNDDDCLLKKTKTNEHVSVLMTLYKITVTHELVTFSQEIGCLKLFSTPCHRTWDIPVNISHTFSYKNINLNMIIQKENRKETHTKL